MRKIPPYCRRAFSLLELSVVLVIIAVLVSFGVTIGTSAIKGANRTTTIERLQLIEEALALFQRANGYYPCPYSRALTPDDATFGLEARDGADPALCATSGSALLKLPASGDAIVYFGGIPVRTLGLPDTYAADAWGNKLLYAVSATHAGVLGSYYTTDGPLVMRYGDRSGTNYTITTAREEDNTNAAGAAAVYVVLSHGADGKGAYPLRGTSVAVSCGSSTANDVGNCDDANVIFYDTAFNDGSQESTFFDDFVVWKSNHLDRIPTTLGGPGAGCSSSCEMWCAPCANSPAATPSMICDRHIASTSPCEAQCIYAYPEDGVLCP